MSLAPGRLTTSKSPHLGRPLFPEARQRSHADYLELPRSDMATLIADMDGPTLTILGATRGRVVSVVRKTVTLAALRVRNEGSRVSRWLRRNSVKIFQKSRGPVRYFYGPLVFRNRG